MKTQKFLNLAFFLLLSANACASDLLIKNANIINPASKMRPQLGYILIHNDRISKMGTGEIKVPSDVPIYDAKKQFLIPGLIDTHNHINSVLGAEDDEFPAHPDYVKEYRKQLPKSYLYFGYTTIIDLVTTDQQAIDAFNAGASHPDLFTCGGGITIANGYPMQYLPENVRFSAFPNFLLEPNQKIKLPESINPADHSPAAIMKRIVDSHAVCVKIFYEKGFDVSDQKLPLPSLASVKEIISLAHQYHLPVMVHANSLSAQQFVLKSGADIFAHGLWNWEKFEGQQTIPQPIQAVLNEVAKKQLGYQPTSQVIYGLSALFNPNFLDDPQLAHVIPKNLLNWYKTKEGQWLAKLMVGKSDPAEFRNRFKMKEFQINSVINYLQKNHAALLFGTDTPSSPTYGNPPGYNGYLEMQNWYRSGVPLAEILRAATTRNAKFFHLDKNVGSLSPGKLANLVLMSKNPLQDISAYDSISAVVLHGEIHERDEFSAQK